MTEDQGLLRELGERITRLETLVSELPSRIDDKIVARDNATRQLVAFNQERLEQMQAATNTLTMTVDALHKRVDQGDHVTGTLKTQQPSLERKVEELEVEVQNLKSELAARQAELRGRDRAVKLAAQIIAFVVTITGGAMTLSELGVL